LINLYYKLTQLITHVNNLLDTIISKQSMFN